MQINNIEFDLNNIQANDVIEVFDSENSEYYSFKVIDHKSCEHKNQLKLISDIKWCIHKIYRQSIVLAYRNNQSQDTLLYFNTKYIEQKYNRIQRKYKVNPKLDIMSNNIEVDNYEN